MLDFLVLVFSGGLVGFAIGLTGVGGGSLMTPIVLLLGYPPPVAIGTDLLYAALTKGSGALFHHRKNNVDWRAMGLLAAGSIPVSLLISMFVLDDDFRDSAFYEEAMTTFLGIMLIVTSLVIIFQKRIQKRLSPELETRHDQHAVIPGPGLFQRQTLTITFLLGVILGICVTFTSVGAGAIGAAILFLLYPKWSAATVVGTDIAHAVPLTLVAGLGYLANGLVDLQLLASLLVGSLPGIWLGTHVGSLFPDKALRTILVIALLCLGLNFTLFY
jgi:uncharacterized membrane protein YfcA